jgi:Gram-negative bacterial TonB protein C-terminal
MEKLKLWAFSEFAFQKMNCFLLVFGLVITTCVNAQTANYTDTTIDGRVYHHFTEPNDIYATYVEQMPKAGYDCGEFFARNFSYPQDGTIVGKIVVTFIVNEDGRLSDFKVVKGREAEAEILRVCKLMPKWKPGMENGKPVKVKFAMPVIIDPK